MISESDNIYNDKYTLFVCVTFTCLIFVSCICNLTAPETSQNFVVCQPYVLDTHSTHHTNNLHII